MMISNMKSDQAKKINNIEINSKTANHFTSKMMPNFDRPDC